MTARSAPPTAATPLVPHDTFPIALRLPYREPYDRSGGWAYLSARLVPGLEEMDGTVYRRTLRLPHGSGAVELEPMRGSIRVGLRLEDGRDLDPAVAGIRRLLQVDADPARVVEELGADPVLGPLVLARPGLRVLGSVEPFETAIRAVVGQQISLRGARTVAGRLVRSYGTALHEPVGSLTHTFPAPAGLVDADGLPMPRSRARAIAGVARAVDAGEVELHTNVDPREAVARLLELPGIGPWTAEYIALRGLSDPDAFPATDLGIRRALDALGVGDRPDVVERWRPLRSYAAQHLWAAPADRRAMGSVPTAQGGRT